MSTNGVSLNGLTLRSFQDVEDALKANQITRKQAKALKALFPKPAKNSGKGVSLEKSDAKALSTEQKTAKEQARQEVLAEVAKAKEQAATTDDKVAQIKKDGVKTEYGVISSHGEGTAYTFDIKAPGERKVKTTKDQERARMARYYDENTGKWIERGEELKTNKEVRKALRAKEKEIKEEAKTAKKENKALTKELSKGQKELAELNIKRLKGEVTKEQFEAKEKEIAQLQAKAQNKADEAAVARDELEQVHQAHTASKRTNFLRKTGVGADKRAYNNNVEADNRLLDRVVVYSDEDKKVLEKAPEMKNRTVKVASDKDLMVLQQLSAKAEQYMSETTDPKEKAMWQELANVFKDEKGNQIPLNQLDTAKVQDALTDLTGGDRRLNYTEQQIIAKETGMSMSEVRHLFHTYGFEAPHPIGKRIVNGLVAAAPVAATMGLSYILTKSKSHAEAHSEATATDDAVADASKTEVVKGEVTSTASTPGYKFDWIDPYTGEEIHKRFSGATVSQTEYYEAVSIANAHAEAHAKAFASADAACEAVATLSPAALIAAPALAFLVGFAKRPAEKGATKDVKAEKLAEMVSMYTHNKNKNIGNQIVQMAGQITGDEATDRALIAAVLRQDIGSQNTVATTRELRSALAHLDAIKAEVDKFKKLPPKEPVKPEPEKTTPTECPVDSWFEPDYSEPITVPRNSHGISPIGTYVIRRGYVGPDGQPVTDEKILRKIQDALKGKIQMNPSKHSQIAAPLQLEIDGKIYKFDCDNALKLITGSKEYKDTVGGGKDPKRGGIKQSGSYFKQDCNDNTPVKTDKSTYDKIQANKKKPQGQ